ncbi:hypothetical protein V2J09_001405 [Rumex salicifolius]
MEEDSGITSAMDNQFEQFRGQLSDTVSIKQRIRSVVVDMETTSKHLQSSLLFLHQSPLSEVLEKAKVDIEMLKKLISQLADIHHDCAGEYYRYHFDWKNEMQMAVSLICFLGWLETGNLPSHAEVEEKLELDASNFGLDIEDYLVGLCFMSNEMPRYVVNQVTSGNYDSPGKVQKFLTDLYDAFRMLNLRNDFLRRKFDGMKYDLRRVTEVYYDVKIRGLLHNDDDNEHP